MVCRQQSERDLTTFDGAQQGDQEWSLHVLKHMDDRRGGSQRELIWKDTGRETSHDVRSKVNVPA